MYLYKNNTRFRAIVTILVESTENKQKALKVGNKSHIECAAEPGYNDCDVGPGESIELINNTVAIVSAIRNAP